MGFNLRADCFTDALSETDWKQFFFKKSPTEFDPKVVEWFKFNSDLASVLNESPIDRLVERHRVNFQPEAVKLPYDAEMDIFFGNETVPVSEKRRIWFDIGKSVGWDDAVKLNAGNPFFRRGPEEYYERQRWKHLVENTDMPLEWQEDVVGELRDKLKLREAWTKYFTKLGHKSTVKDLKKFKEVGESLLLGANLSPTSLTAVGSTLFLKKIFTIYNYFKDLSIYSSLDIVYLYPDMAVQFVNARDNRVIGWRDFFDSESLQSNVFSYSFYIYSLGFLRSFPFIIYQLGPAYGEFMDLFFFFDVLHSVRLFDKLVSHGVSSKGWPILKTDNAREQLVEMFVNTWGGFSFFVMDTLPEFFGVTYSNYRDYGTLLDNDMLYDTKTSRQFFTNFLMNLNEFDMPRRGSIYSFDFFGLPSDLNVLNVSFFLDWMYSGDFSSSFATLHNWWSSYFLYAVRRVVPLEFDWNLDFMSWIAEQDDRWASNKKQAEEDKRKNNDYILHALKFFGMSYAGVSFSLYDVFLFDEANLVSSVNLFLYDNFLMVFTFDSLKKSIEKMCNFMPLDVFLEFDLNYEEFAGNTSALNGKGLLELPRELTYDPIRPNDPFTDQTLQLHGKRTKKFNVRDRFDGLRFLFSKLPTEGYKWPYIQKLSGESAKFFNVHDEEPKAEDRKDFVTPMIPDFFNILGFNYCKMVLPNSVAYMGLTRIVLRFLYSWWC